MVSNMAPAGHLSDFAGRGSQVVADRFVGRLIVEIAEHDDVGLGVGGQDFIDPLAGDVAGLVAERFIRGYRDGQ